MESVSAAIVEDEAVSRRALEAMVAAVPWLTHAGSAGTVDQAVSLLEAQRPDVLFLDVKMPGGSGFDVLERAPFVPHIIFTTAFSDFAVNAFDHNAVDYLMKPFSRRRFTAAIEKLQARLLDGAGAPRADAVSVFVRSGRKMVPLALTDVEYFAAADDYVIAHSGDAEHILNSSLGALEAQLPAEQFVRIHRSHIVNIRFVRFMRRVGDRQLSLSMKSGAELISSRAGTKRLQRFFR